jgi:hypothetical protein
MASGIEKKEKLLPIILIYFIYSPEIIILVSCYCRRYFQRENGQVRFILNTRSQRSSDDIIHNVDGRQYYSKNSRIDIIHTTTYYCMKK